MEVTDAVGNSTTKTLAVNVAKDSQAPTLHTSGELFQAPKGWVQQQRYSFAVSATDPNGYGATSLAFSLDGKTLTETSKPCAKGGCELSLESSVNFASYSGGAHTAELVAADAAGNVERKVWNINVDPSGAASTEEVTNTLEAVEGTAGAGEAPLDEALVASNEALEEQTESVLPTLSEAPSVIVSAHTQDVAEVSKAEPGAFEAGLPQATI